MEESQKDRLRTYAWNYFACHAEQRIKTFNFYLFLVAILVAGFGASITKVEKEYIPWLSVFGFLLTVVSIAFSFLDKRTKELVRNGESALKYLDELEELPKDKSKPNILEIFARDDHNTSKKPKGRVVGAHISYSDVFRFIFKLFGFLGLISAIVCLFINS